MDGTTRALAVAVAGLLGAVVSAYALTPASPEAYGRDDVAAAGMLELVNESRDAHDLPELRPADDVADVAAAWSARMAETRDFGHNPDNATEICCWRKVTENVAWSDPPRSRLSGDPVTTTVEDLHEALLASPGHRRNLLDDDVDEIGIGVHVADDGSVWITQNFRASAR